MHGDISPNNILFKEDAPVLIDLGASEIVRDGEFGQNRIGTRMFTAPEKISGQSTLAADVFSLGATFCYLMEGTPSFRMEDGFWTRAPQSLRSLVLEMMEPSPAKRPSVEMCIGHPFFREMVEDQLLERELNMHTSFNCQ
jgi:serine/threonine protein kinase